MSNIVGNLINSISCVITQEVLPVYLPAVGMANSLSLFTFTRYKQHRVKKKSRLRAFNL